MTHPSEDFQYLGELLSNIIKALPKKLNALRPPLKSLESIIISFLNIINVNTNHISINANDFLASIKSIPHDSYLAEGTDVLKMVTKLLSSRSQKSTGPEDGSIMQQDIQTMQRGSLYLLELGDLLAMQALASSNITLATEDSTAKRTKTKEAKELDRKIMILKLYYDIFSDSKILLPLLGVILRLLSLQIDSHINAVPLKLIELCYCLLTFLLTSGVLFRLSAQLCLQGLLTVEYRRLTKYDNKKTVFHNLLVLESCFSYDREVIAVRAILFHFITCATLRNTYLTAQEEYLSRKSIDIQETDPFVTWVTEDKASTVKYGLCRLFTILLSLDKNFPSASKLKPSISTTTLATDANIYDYASLVFLRVQTSIESLEVSPEQFTYMNQRKYEQFLNIMYTQDILRLHNVLNITYSSILPVGLTQSATRMHFYTTVTTYISQIFSYAFYLRSLHLKDGLPIPRMSSIIDKSKIVYATEGKDGKENNDIVEGGMNTRTTSTDKLRSHSNIAIHMDTIDSYMLSITGEFIRVLSRQPTALVSLSLEMYLAFTAIIKTTQTSSQISILTYRHVSQLLHILIDTISIGLSANSSELYRISLYFFRKLLTIALPMPGLFEIINSILHNFLIMPLNESESADIRGHGLIFIDLLLGTTYSGKNTTYTEKQINILSFLYDNHIANNNNIVSTLPGLYATKPIVLSLLDAVACNLSNHATLTDVSLTSMSHKTLSLESLLYKYVDLSRYVDITTLKSQISLNPQGSNDEKVIFSTVADCAVHVLVSIMRGFKRFLMDRKLTEAQQMLILSNKPLEDHIVSLLNEYRRNTLISEFATASKPRKVIQKMIQCGYFQSDSESIVRYIIAHNFNKKGFGVLLGDPHEHELLEAFADIVFSDLKLFMDTLRQGKTGSTISASNSEEKTCTDYLCSCCDRTAVMIKTESLDTLFTLNQEEIRALRTRQRQRKRRQQQLSSDDQQSNHSPIIPFVYQYSEQKESPQRTENIFLVTIRYYLSFFRIPGESQQIERIMKVFSQHFVHLFSLLPDDIKGGTTFTQELAYILAYAVLMLNTDLHNSSIKEKMTRDMFIRNTKCADKQDLIQVSFLAELYDGIVSSPFSINEIRTKQFIGSHGFPQLCKKLGKYLSIELDCIYQESASCNIQSNANLDECDGILMDTLDENVTQALMSKHVGAEPASESATKDIEVQHIPLASTSTASKEHDEQNSETLACDVAAAEVEIEEPIEPGSLAMPLQKIAYNLQQSTPQSTATPRDSDASNHNQEVIPPLKEKDNATETRSTATHASLPPNSLSTSISVSDIQAFKQYERFLRINIALNMFMSHAVEAVTTYMRSSWLKAPTEFSLAVPELVLHLYRLCEYLIVCQTTQNITEERISDIISREETILRIFEHRSQLLRNLVISSLFYLRRHVWHANIIIPRIVTADLTAHMASNFKPSNSKDDLTLMATLAGEHSTVSFILFILVSSHVNQSTYEACGHLYSLSRALYRFITDASTKSLRQSFVLSNQELSRGIVLQEYTSFHIADNFITPYLRTFININDVLQKLGVHLDVFSPDSLSLSDNTLYSYSNLLDISTVSLLDSAKVSALVLEQYGKELPPYNMIRLPVSIDYLTFMINVFKIRVKKVYGITVNRHGQEANTDDKSPPTAVTPRRGLRTADINIYSPITCLDASKHVTDSSVSKAIVLDMILEEFSLVYSGLIASILYAYIYSNDLAKNSITCAALIRILSKFIKYALYVFKGSFEYSDNKLAKLFFLPLAHLSKLIPYPADLSLLFTMVSDILAEIPTMDDYDAIFAVILSSLYRVMNKGHNISVENGLDELSCTECFHEENVPSDSYTDRSCIFTLDFLVRCRKTSPLDVPILQNTLTSSTIMGEQGASGIYSATSQKKKTALQGSTVLSCITPTASITSSLGASVVYLNEYNWATTYDQLDVILKFLKSKASGLNNVNAGKFCTAITHFTCLGETAISITALEILREALTTILSLKTEHTLLLLECYLKIMETATQTGRTVALKNFIYSIATALVHIKLTCDAALWSSICQRSIFPIIVLQYNRNEYDVLLFMAHTIYLILSPTPLSHKYTSVDIGAKLTHQDLQPVCSSFLASMTLDSSKVSLLSSSKHYTIVSAFFELIIQLMMKSYPGTETIALLFQGAIEPILLVAQVYQDKSSFSAKKYIYDPLFDLLVDRVNTTAPLGSAKEQSVALHITSTATLLKYTLNILLSKQFDLLNSDAFAFLCFTIEGPILDFLKNMFIIYDSRGNLQTDDCEAIASGVDLVFTLANLLTSTSDCFLTKLENSGHDINRILRVVEQGLIQCVSLLTVLSVRSSHEDKDILVQYRRISNELFSVLRAFLIARPAIKAICKTTFRKLVTLALHSDLKIREALVSYLVAYDEEF